MKDITEKQVWDCCLETMPEEKGFGLKIEEAKLEASRLGTK